jgi:hypothetical protein
MQARGTRGAGEDPRQVDDLANSPEFIEEQAKAYAECRECFEKALLEAAWPNLTEDQKKSALKALEMLSRNEEEKEKPELNEWLLLGPLAPLLLLKKFLAVLRGE